MKDTEAMTVLVLGLTLTISAMAALVYPLVQKITNAFVAF